MPYPVNEEKIKKYILYGEYDHNHSTYPPSIGKYIKENYLKEDGFLEKESLIENDDDQNFVFIIDEINRGELSKIFGELFYALEPGYRGKAGCVKTQYSNLIEQNDVFYKGFFIPENVYIIGTMNDIDRGVECMDFAIRRRFAWYEVKAEDRTGMWDEIIDKWKDDAVRKMKSLNTAIENMQGLNSSYHIGPAYFLKLKDYNGDFGLLWNYHLKGVLYEYLRGMPDIQAKLNELKTSYDK